MNERADWFAWTLQFLTGFVVGAFWSFLFIQGGRRSMPLIGKDVFPIFLLGNALIGAALASCYGDPLWIGDSYRCIPPDKPHHSTKSKRASIAVGCTGVILVIVALAESFGFRI